MGGRGQGGIERGYSVGCDQLLHYLLKIRTNENIIFGGREILGWGVRDGLGGVYCGMSGKYCFVSNLIINE